MRPRVPSIPLDMRTLYDAARELHYALPDRGRPPVGFEDDTVLRQATCEGAVGLVLDALERGGYQVRYVG